MNKLKEINWIIIVSIILPALTAIGFILNALAITALSIWIILIPIFILAAIYLYLLVISVVAVSLLLQYFTTTAYYFEDGFFEDAEKIRKK